MYGGEEKRNRKRSSKESKQKVRKAMKKDKKVRKAVKKDCQRSWLKRFLSPDRFFKWR